MNRSEWQQAIRKKYSFLYYGWPDGQLDEKDLYKRPGILTDEVVYRIYRLLCHEDLTVLTGDWGDWEFVYAGIYYDLHDDPSSRKDAWAKITSAPAYYTIGMYYLQDYYTGKGLTWIKKAAELNHGSAIYLLGFFAFGNQSQQLAYYERAAALECYDAQRELIHHYASQQDPRLLIYLQQVWLQDSYEGKSQPLVKKYGQLLQLKDSLRSHPSGYFFYLPPDLTHLIFDLLSHALYRRS